MSQNRSRAVLVGLGAAVSAFGAAAMMSAATAPAARADALTDILNAVDGDLSQGQANFSTALTDFGSNNVSAGLASLDDGVDQYFVSAPNNLLVGGVEALTGESITGSVLFSLTPVPSFAQGLLDAEDSIAGAGGEFSTAATELSMGDYGVATLFDLLGTESLTVVPLEYLLLGAGI